MNSNQDLDALRWEVWVRGVDKVSSARGQPWRQLSVLQGSTPDKRCGRQLRALPSRIHCYKDIYYLKTQWALRGSAGQALYSQVK